MKEYMVRIIIEEVNSGIPLKVFVERTGGIEKMKKSISKGFNEVLKYIREDVENIKTDTLKGMEQTVFAKEAKEEGEGNYEFYS